MNTIKKKLYLFPWLAWGAGVSFYFLQYLARVTPSVLTTQLAHAFSANAFTLGTLSAFFYYAYVPMQIPAGLLVDRFGSGRLLIISTLTATLGSLAFAYTHNLYLAELSRFLIGFGSAFSFICTIKLISIWFKKKHFGLLTSITQASGVLGAICGVGILSRSIERVHWRVCLTAIAIAFAALGLIMLVIMIKSRILLNKQAKQLQIKLKDQASKTSILTRLKIVAKNPQTWINALFAATLYAPITIFCEFWGTSYLHNVYSISVEHAATGISFIFLGWIIGAPIMGYISDRIGQRRPLMIASAFGGLLCLSAILYLPNLSIIYLFTLLFLFGLSNPGVAIAYTLAGEINPGFTAATSIAFVNMASVIFGPLGQPLIGWLLDLHWQGAIINGVHHYSAANYRSSMSILIICLVIACISSFFIKETYCHYVIVEETPEEIPLTNDEIPAISDACYSEPNNN